MTAAGELVDLPGKAVAYLLIDEVG